MSSRILWRGALYGFAAALCFGASVPLSKHLLTRGLAPLVLAALLYFGAGLGASVQLLAGGEGNKADSLRVSDWRWLLPATAVGSVLASVLLAWGIGIIPASESSLLLSLEGAFTSILAWAVFGERAGRRVVLGMAVIVAGSALVSLEPGRLSLDWGALAVAAACLAWAVDNNLVKRISGRNSLQIVAAKGLLGGAVNIGIALALGLPFPSPLAIAGILLAGYLTYGLCLVFMVRSMREIGAARMAAFFSVAPFVGVLLSIAALGERPGSLFLAAAVLVGVGLVLFVTETAPER